MANKSFDGECLKFKNKTTNNHKMKKILLFVLAFLAIAIVGALLFFGGDAKNPYQNTTWGRFTGTSTTEEAPDANFGENYRECNYSVPAEEIPVFESVDFPFTNQFNSEASLPLMAAALIDVNNDGVDEVFVCLLYTSPSPRDKRQSRMPSSA